MNAGPILLAAGARPNFMKIAPIAHALREARAPYVIVHTGQHYGQNMSDTFFDELCIPVPTYYLGVGSFSHAVQTARVMEAFEPVVEEVGPAWVVVVGDVNSTLACALVAAKLRPVIGCRVAHVEAGLRSRDWRMPEELNRVVTDRISDLLFIPSRDAGANLTGEGIPEGKIVFAGNVMIDTLMSQLPAARASRVHEAFGLAQGAYALVTLHRPSNVDDRDSLKVILDALVVLSKELPVVFPAHPRTRSNVSDFGLTVKANGLSVTDPFGYREMLGMMDGAAIVLTDSGGVQEETTVLGVPCVTLREQTERPITITEGTNRLAPWPLTVDGIVAAAHDALQRRHSRGEIRLPERWDGCAGQRIATSLTSDA